MRMLLRFVPLIAAFEFGLLGPCASETDFGRFEGELVLKAVGAEGRDMQLVAPYTYIDPDKKLWPVPSGTVVNGASIPSAFWSILGAPYTGAYRDAAVIHDHYCVTKDRAWRDVHLAFYHGMRAKGVGPVKAQAMYAAVYTFGPRWELADDGKGRSVTIAGTPRFDADAGKRIEAFAGGGERTISEINAFADEATKVVDTGFEIKTDAGCDAVVSSIATGAPPYQLCGLDDNERRLIAARNLGVLIGDLESLDKAQTQTLMPAIRRFQAEPTEENWKAASESVKVVRTLVRTAILSALDYDPSLKGEITLETGRLLQILRSRGFLLDALSQGPPKDATQLQSWIEDYTKLMLRLRDQLSQLRARLLSSG